MSDYNTVIDFWFSELSPSQHWVKDPKLDNEIRERFLTTHKQATQAELYKWREHPLGRLAEIVVLDQFSRNIYRDQAKAFESDAIALILSQQMVADKSILELDIKHRGFAIMPYMHSESLIIHDEALSLFSNPEYGGSLEFEKKHRNIIVRFGRYPHRNKILSRTSTPEELEFLKQKDSSF